jgi:hypothetical protein
MTEDDDFPPPGEALRAAEPATIAYGLGMTALGAYLGVQGMAKYLHPLPPEGWLATAHAASYWCLAVFTVLVLGAFALDQYRA